MVAADGRKPTLVFSFRGDGAFVSRLDDEMPVAEE